MYLSASKKLPNEKNQCCIFKLYAYDAKQINKDGVIQTAIYLKRHKNSDVL